MCYLRPYIIYVFIVNFQMKSMTVTARGNVINYDPDDLTFKIIGGKRTSTEKWPYVTALNFYNGTHNSFCAGSLIRKNWVLTAAHCVPVNLVEVYGVILRDNLVEEEGYTSLGILVTTHNRFTYKENNITNDIALVKLKQPLNVPLFGIATLAENPLVKKTACQLFGWGLNQKINTGFHFYVLKAEVITVSQCANILNDKVINEEKICTVWRRQHVDYCIGNTGGPLICDGQQYGILSWGSECSQTYPLVWTRIEYYLDWINTVIRLENNEENTGKERKIYLDNNDDLLQNPQYLSPVYYKTSNSKQKEVEKQVTEKSVEEKQVVEKQVIIKQVVKKLVNDEEQEEEKANESEEAKEELNYFDFTQTTPKSDLIINLDDIHDRELNLVFYDLDQSARTIRSSTIFPRNRFIARKKSEEKHSKRNGNIKARKTLLLLFISLILYLINS